MSKFRDLMMRMFKKEYIYFTYNGETINTLDIKKEGGEYEVGVKSNARKWVIEAYKNNKNTLKITWHYQVG